MMQWLKSIRHREYQGQSLVEIALFLPILIFVLAGIVEVSNLLITQNRVTTASRISAGFGASNFDENDWANIDPGTEECLSGTACSMGTVAINTVTETLDLSPDVWDVWSISARFNDDGDAFEVFTHTHSYGEYAVISAEEWTQLINVVENDMLSDFEDGNRENLAVIATVAYHDIGTILGIPVWQWTGLQTIRGLTVMRVDEKLAFGGCPILPIAIRLNQWSIYPTNWDDLDGPNLSKSGTAPINLFPDPGDWQYPDPAPVYSQLTPVFTETTQVTANSFPRNVPGVHLADAKPGHLYWARDLNSDPSGNFGWLSWQDVSNASALGNSLTWPGDFVDPDPLDSEDLGYRGSSMDLGTGADCPGTDTGNGDGYLAIDEWVANAPGNMNANSIKSAMQFFVDTGMPVFLIVFEFTNQESHPPEWTCSANPGSNVHFRVHEFAKVRLVGYKYQSNDKWIVFEFLDWGIRCNLPVSQ